MHRAYAAEKKKTGERARLQARAFFNVNDVSISMSLSASLLLSACRHAIYCGNIERGSPRNAMAI